MPRYLRSATTIVFLILLHGPARAGLTPLQEVTETMMQAQGDQSLFIGAAFGPDGRQSCISLPWQTRWTQLLLCLGGWPDLPGAAVLAQGRAEL